MQYRSTAVNTRHLLRSGSRLLKTRQLMLLLHLYEVRSVLRASELANMTQPAASKLLAEMESVLGVPLFERHARGIEPTWYCEMLVRRVRSAMSELMHAHDEINALKEGRLGKAAIGTVVNPSTNLVPLAVAQLKAQFPEIQISVEMDYSRPLVAKLLDGELDIVIGRIMDPELSHELVFEALADEPHSVIARADHPLSKSKHLELADLAESGWIMPPDDSVIRARLNSAFLERGVPWPRNIIVTNSLPLTVSMLRESDFITALPAESLSYAMQAGNLVCLPIDLGVRMEDFGIIRSRSQSLSPAAERMLQFLRDVAVQIYPPRVR